jgi:hypothetical protein
MAGESLGRVVAENMSHGVIAERWPPFVNRIERTPDLVVIR